MDSDKPNLAGKIRITSVEGINYLQLAMDMLEIAANTMGHENLNYYFKRAEIAALIAIAQRPEPVLQTMTRAALDESERSAAAWQETAEMHLKNETYYHDLLEKIGELFGDAAKRADNGDMMTDVICVKVPELVEEQARDLTSAMQLLRLLDPNILCNCVACKHKKNELSRLLHKYQENIF